MRNNLKTYQKVNRESGLVAADPHTVILMLLNGTLESISIAQGAIERKDLNQKSTQLSKAINIIRSLRSSLDKESEPQISKNFDDLYAYCIDALMDVSVSLDIARLDEVINLLKPIRDAWKEMSDADKQQGIIMLDERNKAKERQLAGA